MMATGWRDRAACAGHGPDIFFPTHGHKTTLAAALCAACPVSVECRAYARAEAIPYGTWGALSEQDRPEAFLNADRRDRRQRYVRRVRREHADDMVRAELLARRKVYDTARRARRAAGEVVR